MTVDRTEEATRRLEIVEGLLRAFEQRKEIDAAVEGSSDRNDAMGRLTGTGFGFTPRQANHILDMNIGRRTQLGRDELTREREQLLGGSSST